MEAREVAACGAEGREGLADVVEGEYGGAVGGVPGDDEAGIGQLRRGGCHWDLRGFESEVLISI